MNSPSAGTGGPPRGPQFDNRRVVAGLIDLVVVAAVGLAVSFVAGFIAGPDKEMPAAMGMLFLAWALFYYFACESAAGQTLGKRIMGLRVRAVDGSDADMGAIGARTVLRIVDGIGFYVVGLIVMVATGQRRQRLGDLAGKTIVTGADWEPATSAAPAAAAVATGPAIVLPSEAPELPAAAAPAPAAEVPSPFTPLAIEPEPTSPAAVAEETPAPSEPPSISDGSVEVGSMPPVEPAAKDPIVDGPADGSWEPVPAEPEEDDDEPVKLRSVETLSAMDMLMSELEEDEPAGHRPAS
jgi:uncharacterized RDD family membrane protein YckC